MGRRISAASFFLRGGAPAFTGDSASARGGGWVAWPPPSRGIRVVRGGFGWCGGRQVVVGGRGD